MSTQPSYLSYLQQLQQNGQLPPEQAQSNAALTPPASQSTPGGLYAPSGSVDAGPYGNPYATSTPGLDMGNSVNNSNFYNDQSIDYAQENQLQGEAEAQLGYYGPLQEQETGQAQGALDSFAATPGYTPAQAGQINVDYSQYNTPQSEQQAELGDPAAAQQVLNQGVSGEGAMLNQYQANLGGELGNADNWTGSAVSGLSSGLTGAQSDFSGLNSAVSNPALAFNPGGYEQEITPAQMQQMETAAGTTVGNQYQSAEDQLKQSAANAGNTSPLAIAAANARLNTQSASQAGDAETQAAIAALQAQEQQATSMEGQRESAAQYQSGLQATASTTEEAAAQNAAALAGQTGVSAAEEMGQEGLNAANQYGEFSTDTQGNIAGQQYNAANLAGQEETANATTVANQQYQQGTGSASLTAGGATNVGQQDIAGRNTYLSGTTQQESLAQQGGETAEGSQQTAASTLGSQLNTSEANAGAFKNNSPTLASQSSQLISSILDEGAIITEPTVALIGEKRPEIVVPLPRYKPQQKDQQEEA